MNTDILLTPGEVSRLLGVTHQTLRNWYRAGHLDAVRPGRNGRNLAYPAIAVRALLKGERPNAGCLGRKRLTPARALTPADRVRIAALLGLTADELPTVVGR